MGENLFPDCELLIGNKPENDSDAQYSSCTECHGYQICENYKNGYAKFIIGKEDIENG